MSSETRKKWALRLPTEVALLAPLEAGRSAAPIPGGQEVEQLTSQVPGRGAARASGEQEGVQFRVYHSPGATGTFSVNRGFF